MESDYKIVRELGTGAFGRVYLIKHNTEPEWFALKTVNLSRADAKERASAEKEANLMRDLNHDHVVRYVASTINGTTLFIFTEYCEGGDLSHFLEDSSGKLPEDLIVCWLYQTASALAYLHERTILHRDLKPQNIYLTGEGDIKLGDLGIARVLDKGVALALTMAGTPFYMSPEIFQMKGYDHKTDIWSFGCVVYEIAAGEHAFDAPNMSCLIFAIVSGKVPLIHTSYSDGLRELVKSMMDRDPDERPSAEQLLNCSPVKEFGNNTQRPMTIIKKFKFRTKWGTHDSSVDISRMFTSEELNPPPCFGEHDIRIPKDSLLLHRKRLGRPSPLGLSEKVKTNTNLSVIRFKEEAIELKLEEDPSHTAVMHSVMRGLMGVMVDSQDRTLTASAILPSVDITLTGSQGLSAETATDAEVILNQIQVLQTDCAKGLGEDKFRRAYSILDFVQDASKLKVRLVDLIGEDMFRKYSEKIMCLRMFENGLQNVGSKKGQ
ncbi:uncharacterized protein [Haliotis asinina]|uniref:uncharacterized protein n=1 Tax=Haliotis asinina TaxID=109174 RepID=UPI003531C9F7